MKKHAVKRLIDWFVPEHYEISVSQDAENLQFSGHITIHGNATTKACKDKCLYLHASELTILAPVMVDDTLVAYELDEQTQLMTIHLPELDSKTITLRVSFEGKITKPMHGLYPCFFEHDGKEKRLLATQFESHHAREVFPCVDEPEAKSTFQLTLTTHHSDVAISNTPVVNETISTDGLTKTVVYETTPRMSTYLLAWVSGELIYTETTTSHGVKVRTYATPIHEGKLNFATETAARAMDFMDDYFAIPYPLPKFDQIALPDFAAGAMENWGCVTFRESALLFDPEHSDLHDKQHIADVVIHELSHQWFGNLVTMRWWNDLWLNEGFASWVPYMVRDELFPEWNIWEHFATGDLAIGLRADALANTHPIVVDIGSPEEIRSAFDSISYDKGASVINLLYHYIGKEAFREGLRKYLKKHAYSNAETLDLWRAWSVSSGKDVVGFMHSWTETPGFPIIEARSDSSGMSLKQSRFFINPNTHRSSQLWPIPLIRNENDIEVMTAELLDIDTYTKLNHGQSGFYRVVYSGKAQEKLAELLKAGTLSTADSIGLVSDAAEAAKAGYYSSTDALELLQHLKHSQSEQVVCSALAELAEIRSVFPDTYEPAKLFTKKFIAANLARLGTNQKSDDTIDDELLRPSILAAASYAGEDNVVTWALREFVNALKPEDIRPEIRGIVYQTAVRELDDVRCYEKLFRWYQNTTIPGEQTTLAVALAGFKNKELAARSLEQIRSERVKLQDALYWIAYGLKNRHNKSLAWQWVQDNWSWVVKNFGNDKEIDYYLRFSASGFATHKHLAEYTTFFESVNIFGSVRAFEQGKETIQWQTAWRERDEQKVIQWFQSH